MDKVQKNFSFLCKIIKKTPNNLAFYEKRLNFIPSYLIFANGIEDFAD